MSYRVLCDENVEPRTVEDLEAAGKTATHVNAEPGRSSTDGEVARHALEHDFVLLTNDDDFLGGDGSDLTVLYFPDNAGPAHELVSRVTELQDYYPAQVDLPGTYFLTTDIA